MQLTLVLESAGRLAAPARDRVTFGDLRSLSIGRAAGAGWQLSDAERLISAVHCEIRREAGSFFVHDLSSNGTFVNGATTRLAAPHRLRDRDTLTLGRCVVRALLSAAATDAEATRNLRGTMTLPPGGAPALRLQITPETQAGQAGATGIDLRPEQPVRIGRDAEADWTLSDSSGRISRIHCEVRFHDGAFFLHDHSRNGTFLEGSGERLAGAHRLRPDDRFGIGGFVVQVHATMPQASPPAARHRGGDPAAMVLQAAAGIDATRLIPAASAAGAVAAADVAAGADAAAGALAEGLGLLPADLAGLDAVELARSVGALLRLATAELASLLTEVVEPAAESGRAPRDRARPHGNNPLERLPPDEALRVMLGPPRRLYLDGPRTLQVSVERVRQALAAGAYAGPEAARKLLQQLSPESIEEAVPRPGPLSRLTHAGKAALWDEYVRRWSAATAAAAATPARHDRHAPLGPDREEPGL